MKLSIVALSLLLSLLLGGVVSAASATSLIEKEKSQTVLISNVGFGGMGLGTGIVVDSHHIVTCAHMIEGSGDRLMVYTYPLGRVYSAHVDFVDQYHDILFLIVDSTMVVRNAKFQSKVEDGEPVTVVGNTLGAMGWYISRGVISGSEQYFLLTDASVNHGNSGGPWFNDKGEVIGMSDWTLGPDKGMVGIRGGISSAQILKTIEGHKSMENILAALLGLK